MKMFSDCSGPCVVCACSGSGCLAGHGDDDFVPAGRATLHNILVLRRWGGTPDGRELTESELALVQAYLLRAEGW